MSDTTSRTYHVIRQYCENEDVSNGLFLVDLPTGFGKTHAVLDYIFDAVCDKRFEDKKIFFITTLKKNLPEAELKARFEKAGQLNLFKEKFLFIDSNADSVINNLTTDVINAIPNEIRYSDEYKALQQDVLFLQKQQKSSRDELKGFAPSIRDNLRRVTEPSFRRYIQMLLSKRFRNAKDRLYAIKTDPQWQWLGIVYPAVFTKERQIIFMSMDKFLSQNSTIIEPSSMLYNSPVIKDALVFIDEFDATKETILKNIVQNGLRDKIDYLNLFREIYAALQTSKFPKKLTTPSKQRQEGPYKDQSLQSVIDSIKEKANEIHEEYSLQYSHKTATDLVDTSRNFLFQDHQFHSILDADKSFIVTSSDAAQQINTIKFSKDKPTSEKNNIQFLLGKLRGFVKYFQGGVNILAINYQQCKMEQRQDGDDDFTLESAIQSVLTEFSLSDFHKDYITSQILIASHRNSGNIEGSEFDLKFYENGFRYYAFLDEPSHDMRSRIMMYGFQTTPEKILLRFCERAKVVGISATATVPSVLGNFDLDYLRSKLQKSFVELTQEDKAELSNEFHSSSLGYKDININVNLISGEINGEYSATSWKQVFEDQELAQYAFNTLEQKVGIDDNDYNKQRYCRIAKAYKEFVCHPDILSFLCVLTKHPRVGDSKLDLNLLLDLFQKINKENGISRNPKDMVYQLDGEEYDNKKDFVQKKLEKGEKLFVISVYQTIGAGQNLQYKTPGTVSGSLVSTNSFDSRGEKDFDAIYLDKPTNVLVPLEENMDEEAFVRYLFQTEFLQENAELSTKDAFSHIKKAFVTFYTGHVQPSMWATDVYKSKSTMLLSTRTIIQAIGRICRTNHKQRNIYIFADKRISESIDPSVSEDRLLNPEFTALLKKLSEEPTPDIRQKKLEDAASLLSVRVNRHINNILNEEWSEGRVDDWKQLRKLVLISPTMSREEVQQNFIADNFYIELPEKRARCWYNQSGDYNNITVSFTKTSEFPYEVSENAARLNKLMGISELKRFFESKGCATSFTPNDYIMSPALFNNIYKGALGEEIGRYIMETRLGVSLEEITDLNLFELFDFKIKDKPIYVDFKHWEESTQFVAEDILKKISAKASVCGAKRVIVANILADKKYPVHSTKMGDIEIVEIPALIYSDGQEYRRSESVWNSIREVVDECSD